MIRSREGVHSSQQRLIYGGKQLVDGKGLDDYCILGESTVYLMLRLCGGERLDRGHGCVTSSEKRLGKGKNAAVEQDAVSKLRSERQRWAEECAKREIALLEKKRAQYALELERAKSAEMETEIAQREEQVLAHLQAARQLQTQMEIMLRREQPKRVRDLYSAQFF